MFYFGCRTTILHDLTGQEKFLEDPTVNLYLSIASLWEITIKQSLGKLRLEYSLDELVESCNETNITILPIDIETLKTLKSLPFLHRDPFDRIIIATSLGIRFGFYFKRRNS
ncbi:type II toxin-antitoxin system VapC family toxin [Pedobacter terrae]|uniref:type II toxin-antitoxin system VapC family toxin n=1 Tax=Pedobacter terrae TaxID=405671 RepID=UPI003FA7B9DD